MRLSRLAVASIAATLLVALTPGGAIASPAMGLGAKQAADSNRPPYVVHFKWGTFKLSSRIAAKIEHHQPINYVMSIEGTGIPIFSPQFEAGYKLGVTQGDKIYPLNAKLIAPVQHDPTQQVAQIDQLAAANEIDCLSIEPETANSFNSTIDKLVADGIPVFIVSNPSGGHWFTSFAQNHIKEGMIAGDTMLNFMKSHPQLHLKYFALMSSQPYVSWAYQRMAYFEKTVKAGDPGAVFLNSAKTALSTGGNADETTAYNAVKSYILGHPKVQVILHTDVQGGVIDRVISDLGDKGKIFSLAWNPTVEQLTYVEQGIQIAIFDQNWIAQAAFGGNACATFMKTGKILPNTNTLKVVTRANAAQAMKQYSKYPA